MIEIENKIANIKIVGSGALGKRAVEKIQQNKIEGEETFLIDAERIISENGSVGIGDMLAGTDILIFIFEPDDKNDYLAAIAALASKMNILVLGMTAKPAGYRIKENDVYSNMMHYGIDSLFTFSDEEGDLAERITDSIQSLVSAVNVAMIINLDYKDLCCMFKNRGIAQLGVGYGQGGDIGLKAAEMAYMNCGDYPDMHNASTAMLLISGDISLMDASEASEYVRSRIADEADIIFAATYDEKNEDTCKITLLATGFDSAQSGGTD